jgi:hypothetical protein
VSSAPAGESRFGVRGLLRSPAALYVLVSASLAAFEGMHRGLGEFGIVPSGRDAPVIRTFMTCLLGMITAVAFFLLSHWAGRIHDERRRPSCMQPPPHHAVLERSD